MNKALLLLLSAAVCSASLQAQTYSGSLTTSSPTFNRPTSGTPPSTLSTGGTATYYKALSVPITTTGSYTFAATSAYDNFGVLYNTSGFNPASPLTNAITAKDDANGSNLNFSITETLSVGSYTLVFTTFDNGFTGPFSITTTGPANVALPLYLLAFDVKKASGTAAIINWMTAQEEGVSHFEIEKSTDGLQYTSLSQVKAKGNNKAGDQTYSVTDGSLQTGKNYYRLKMVDISGAISYSNTTVITGQGRMDYASIYPNPAGETAYFGYESVANSDVTLSIMDVTGRTLSSQVYRVNEGANYIPLNLSGFPTATYLVRWSCGTEAGTLNVVKH